MAKTLLVPTEGTKLLIEKLESGEYEQGVSCLRTPDNKFCCLGVGTDLFHRATGIGKWVEDEKGPIEVPFQIEDRLYDETPPPEVEKWLGLNQAVFLSNTLMHKNDAEERSFTEIAAYLRERFGLPKQNG